MSSQLNFIYPGEIPESYKELPQTANMKGFAIIGDGSKPVTTVAKFSILGLCGGSWIRLYILRQVSTCYHVCGRKSLNPSGHLPAQS